MPKEKFTSLLFNRFDISRRNRSVELQQCLSADEVRVSKMFLLSPWDSKRLVFESDVEMDIAINVKQSIGRFLTLLVHVL
jgi:hypothetical protein